LYEQKTSIQLVGRHRLVEQREEQKKIKNKLLFLFIFIIANVSFLLFLRSPFFVIENIHIEGLDKLTREEIYNAGGMREGMNIWKISPPHLRARIMTIPRVAEASVERILPGDLTVFIKEKYPVVLIPFHGYYLEVAKDGLIIGLRDEYRGELPLVSGLFWGKIDVGTRIPDRVRGEVIETILPLIYGLSALPLAEINVADPQHIIVYTQQGMEVWLGDGNDLVKKLEVLMHIYPRLSSASAVEGYLDLRVPETPVFVPLENIFYVKRK
jgi:cell division protein FtsQ